MNKKSIINYNNSLNMSSSDSSSKGIPLKVTTAKNAAFGAGEGGRSTGMLQRLITSTVGRADFLTSPKSQSETSPKMLNTSQTRNTATAALTIQQQQQQQQQQLQQYPQPQSNLLDWRKRGLTIKISDDPDQRQTSEQIDNDEEDYGKDELDKQRRILTPNDMHSHQMRQQPVHRKSFKNHNSSGTAHHFSLAGVFEHGEGGGGGGGGNHGFSMTPHSETAHLMKHSQQTPTNQIGGSGDGGVGPGNDSYSSRLQIPKSVDRNNSSGVGDGVATSVGFGITPPPLTNQNIANYVRMHTEKRLFSSGANDSLSEENSDEENQEDGKAQESKFAMKRIKTNVSKVQQNGVGGNAMARRNTILGTMNTMGQSAFQSHKSYNTQTSSKNILRSRYGLLVIPASSGLRTKWDILIIILSLWICFSLPVQIAFQPLALDGEVNYYLNLFADIVYMLDIFVNFRTTIKNSLTNDEITHPKVIALLYLKGRFFIDLLASIPFDIILNNTESDQLSIQLRIFSILKMIRILRFTKIISYLNATQNVKLSLKLLKLIFYLVVYLHLQACAWFFYTQSDRMWYPLPDIIQGIHHFYDEDPLYQYCFSVWHSVSILDGDDMVPANAHQALVVSVLVILSEFIHAHILGTIGVVVSALSHKSTRFQEQIEFVTSAMKNLKLSEDIQKNIIEYITLTQNEQDAQREMEDLMSMISPNLKNQVTQYLFLNAIKNVSIFNTSPDLIEYLLHTIEALHYMPEEYIVRQGQKATSMFLLAHGQCEVLVRDQFKKESFVRMLNSGTIFGEVSLLFGTRRTASIRCKDHCTLGSLSEEHFKDMLNLYPELQKMMIQNTRKYKDHWKMFQIGVLSDVDYLTDMSFKTKEKLHYKLQLEYLQKGAKLFAKGTECKAIYFVTGGEVELYVENEGKEEIFEDLYPGSVIGSYSAINSSVFPFSARAKTNIALLVLYRADLFTLAEKSDNLSDAIEEGTQYIIDNDVPLCDYIAIKDKHLSQIERFRDSVKRLMLLNKGRGMKKVKLIEVIEFVKKQKHQAKDFIKNLMEIQQLKVQKTGRGSTSRRSSKLQSAFSAAGVEQDSHHQSSKKLFSLMNIFQDQSGAGGDSAQMTPDIGGGAGHFDGFKEAKRGSISNHQNPRVSINDYARIQNDLSILTLNMQAMMSMLQNEFSLIKQKLKIPGSLPEALEARLSVKFGPSPIGSSKTLNQLMPGIVEDEKESLIDSEATSKRSTVQQHVSNRGSTIQENQTQIDGSGLAMNASIPQIMHQSTSLVEVLEQQLRNQMSNVNQSHPLQNQSSQQSKSASQSLSSILKRPSVNVTNDSQVSIKSNNGGGGGGEGNKRKISSKGQMVKNLQMVLQEQAAIKNQEQSQIQKMLSNALKSQYSHGNKSLNKSKDKSQFNESTGSKANNTSQRVSLIQAQEQLLPQQHSKPREQHESTTQQIIQKPVREGQDQGPSQGRGEEGEAGKNKDLQKQAEIQEAEKVQRPQFFQYPPASSEPNEQSSMIASLPKGLNPSVINMVMQMQRMKREGGNQRYSSVSPTQNLSDSNLRARQTAKNYQGGGGGSNQISKNNIEFQPQSSASPKNSFSNNNSKNNVPGQQRYQFGNTSQVLQPAGPEASSSSFIEMGLNPASIGSVAIQQKRLSRKDYFQTEMSRSVNPLQISQDARVVDVSPQRSPDDTKPNRDQENMRASQVSHKDAKTEISPKSHEYVLNDNSYDRNNVHSASVIDSYPGLQFGQFIQQPQYNQKIRNPFSSSNLQQVVGSPDQIFSYQLQTNPPQGGGGAQIKSGAPNVDYSKTPPHAQYISLQGQTPTEKRRSSKPKSFTTNPALEAYMKSSSAIKDSEIAKHSLNTPQLQSVSGATEQAAAIIDQRKEKDRVQEDGQQIKENRKIQSRNDTKEDLEQMIEEEFARIQ